MLRLHRAQIDRREGREGAQAREGLGIHRPRARRKTAFDLQMHEVARDVVVAGRRGSDHLSGSTALRAIRDA